MNKNGLELSFAWIFAALLGGVILFIAVFFASRVSETQNERINLETAKEISNALSPFETGIASAKSGKLEFAQETRVFNRCYDTGIGKQMISVSTKSFSKWSEQGGEISVKDRYVFSSGMIEGADVYLIAKEFSFPFKSGSIIIMYSDSYCFKDSPDEVREDLEKLNIGNIKFDNCGSGDIKVCFEEGCDISVYSIGGDYDTGYVEKDSKRVYYVGELLYGAIFSEPEVYEGNVKRIAKRVSELASLYGDEMAVYAQGCGLGVQNSLYSFSAQLNGLSSSESLIFPLKERADDLNLEHSRLIAECQIWE